MDKWTEILELVNTIEERRKRLLEILESLEFEHDTTRLSITAVMKTTTSR
jgi:hypothetical protein